MASDNGIAVELEHAIGFSGSIPGALHVLPSSPRAGAGSGTGPSDRFIAAAGACAVINSVTDPHSQVFLRGHRGNISVMGLSPSGRLLATGEKGFDSDVIVWDAATRTVLHRFQEHDHGIAALAFSDDERLLITVGADSDGQWIVWDLSTGGIVTRQRHDPSPTTCVAFGGFAKDIKGRDTTVYQFATAGAKGITLWTLDPITGACARERISQPVASSLARDYLCLTFSPGPQRDWIYAGSASGDIVIVHVKSMVIYHSTFACGGGVTSLLAMPVQSSQNELSMGQTGYGAAVSRYGGGPGLTTLSGLGSAPPSVDLLVGGGDGAVSIWHHATTTIDTDAVLAAPVSSAHAVNSSNPRPSLASRTFVQTRSVKLDGAVWSISVFDVLASQQPSRLLQHGGGYGGSRSATAAVVPAAGGSYGFLAGTAAGTLYRCYTAEGPSRITAQVAGSSAAASAAAAGGPRSAALAADAGSVHPDPGHGSGLAASVFRQAHACGGDGYDPANAATIAPAANPGVVSLPAPLKNVGNVGTVDDVSFAPGQSDRFATIGSDNSIRVWDLTDYACVGVAHVRSAGHPSSVVYAGEFHLSGWQDGGLRVYYSDPSASSPHTGGTTGFGSTYQTERSVPSLNHHAGVRSGHGSAAGGVQPRDSGDYKGSPSRKARGGHEDTGFLWSIPEAHSSKSGGVTALALSHNQRFCVTGGGDARVRVWDMRSREMVSAFIEHHAPITGLAIYRDDAHVLSCSGDKSFMCWDLRKETRISQHTQRSGGLHCIAITRDQSLVVTAGQEKKVQLWDLREASPVMSIAPVHGLDGEALSVAPANGRDVIATGGTDGIVKLWDLRSTGRALAECVGHSGHVRKVRWAPDDKQFVSVGSDGAILMWNVYA